MYGGEHELDPHHAKVCKISQVSDLSGAISLLVLNTSLLNLATFYSVMLTLSQKRCSLIFSDYFQSKVEKPWSLSTLIERIWRQIFCHFEREESGKPDDFFYFPGSMPPNSHTIFDEGAVFMSFKLVDGGIFQEEGIFSHKIVFYTTGSCIMSFWLFPPFEGFPSVVIIDTWSFVFHLYVSS